MPVELYTYRVNKPVKWSVRCNAELKDRRPVFGEDDFIVLSAGTGGGVYYQSVFKAVNNDELQALRKKQAAETRRLAHRMFVLRNHSRVKAYTKTLREKGIFGTLKHGIYKLAVKITGENK